MCGECESFVPPKCTGPGRPREINAITGGAAIMLSSGAEPAPAAIDGFQSKRIIPFLNKWRQIKTAKSP